MDLGTFYFWPGKSRKSPLSPDVAASRRPKGNCPAFTFG